MELPNKVLVKVRINPRRAGLFIDAGLKLVERTEADDAALRQRQEEEAKTLGRDPYRGKRIDATGHSRPDSGTPIFGWDPKGRQNVSLRFVMKDLTNNLDMACTQVHLLQKPGDRMIFLIVQFEAGKPVTLAGSAKELLDDVLDSVYEHVHAFRNADGTWTINAAHRQAEEPVEGVRDFRVRHDGEVRCVLRP